jgi:outer membrane murein-binding lipoprotein Lpp
MAMASVEIGIEVRIARLESDVGHMRVAIADIKTDLRALCDRVDRNTERLNAKIDALREALRAAKV